MYLGFASLELLGVWVFMVECLGFYLDSQFSSVWVFWFHVRRFGYVGLYYVGVCVFGFSFLEHLGVWAYMFRAFGCVVFHVWT